MRLYRFRHPGFRDLPAEVPVPEVSDLDDRQLRRLVVDMRHRIMIRDTFSTVEGLFWSYPVGQAVWGILHQATMEESHARAIAEHVRRGFRFTGFGVAARGPGDIRPSLGAFLRRTIANAGASDVRPAERDGKS